MVTRPGYIYGGPTDGWVAIGQDAAVNPFKYQATAPTSPATGDIWIDSSSTVNSIDSTQMLRWRKTMAGGETSLSGNDDSSLPLTYTPGYEQLYINGVLQVRGVDYTATTGTTVTGLTALVANDVVEIFSAVARAVSDVYTQSQSDARFVNKNVGGLNLIVPTSITKGTSGTASVTANGQITFTGTESIAVDGCFSDAYQHYRIVFEGYATDTANDYGIQFRESGVTKAASYYGARTITNAAGTVSGYGISNLTVTYMSQVDVSATNRATAYLDIHRNPGGAACTINGQIFGAYNTQVVNLSARNGSMTNATGFIIALYSATKFTGTIRIYGYNNGA